MSRKESRPAKGPDLAVPVAKMFLSGIVKTSKGYAVATAAINSDGTVDSIALGRSQLDIRFVAKEHQRGLYMAALDVLNGRQK